MKDYIAYLKFDDFDEGALFNSLTDDILFHRKKLIVTPNLDILRQTYRDRELRSIINTADYSTIDGAPILKLAKKEKKPSFKHKISGSDMINDFLPMINKNGWSLIIFGGKEGVGEKAKHNILAKYPNICFKDIICPKFGFEKELDIEKEYVKRINSSNADIVLLCLSFPKAERFYYRNKDVLNHSLYFCVGATVDFLAGAVKRAPKWMSKIGLEWLFRLTKDFRRLFKRYWLDFWFLIKIRFLYLFNRKVIENLKI